MVLTVVHSQVSSAVRTVMLFDQTAVSAVNTWCAWPESVNKKRKRVNDAGGRGYMKKILVFGIMFLR